MRLPLTLAVFAKNNEDSIELCINSVKDIVKEIILVNTGSEDKTVEKAEKLGARCYHVGFSDFGAIRTLTAHLSHQPWILGLDTDEIIAPEEKYLLKSLIETSHVDAWGLPRRRYLDLERTYQVEKEAYPDWQYRLIRNKPDKIWYTDRIHERLVCNGTVQRSDIGPHIEHFQDVFKSGERMIERNNLYRMLYAQDLECGIKHSVPPVASIDDEEDKK